MSGPGRGYRPAVKWFIIPSRVFCLTLLCLAVQGAEKVSVVSIDPEDLVEYETQPESVRKLIEVSLSLTKKKLGYQFGSNSPENWGMDCSGTVQCTLKMFGMEKVPRSSWDFFEWTKNSGFLKSAHGVTSIHDPALSELKPGDLLFWEGTYDTGDRVPAISHVMIFLGTLKSDGAGVMFGSSSGRRYRGKSIHGVSVFDWSVPGPESESKFVGYGAIPGLKDNDQPLIAIPVEKPNPLKTTLELIFKKSEASPSP